MKDVGVLCDDAKLYDKRIPAPTLPHFYEFVFVEATFVGPLNALPWGYRIIPVDAYSTIASRFRYVDGGMPHMPLNFDLHISGRALARVRNVKGESRFTVRKEEFWVRNDHKSPRVRTH
jgi:hypothetical protein